MAKHRVRIVPPMSYEPASLEVKVGDTVVWVSEDDTDVHTVTHNDGTTFASPLLNNTQTFEHTFTSVGEANYFCTVHGEEAMSGVVKVVAAGATRHTVEILPDMTYKQTPLSISVGDTVEWISRDPGDVHTVTHDDQTTFGSGLLNEGETFAFTFTSAGDFPYFCEVHGRGMSGVIKAR